MPYTLPERVETARFTLRRARVSDAEDIFCAYATDAQVMRFLSAPIPGHPDQTRAFLAQAEANWDAGTRFNLAILPKGEDRILGMIETRVEGAMVAYGYVLARAAWGQGCMSEVLRWHVGHALAHPSIWRVEALCDAENLASARVMEKVGMLREGLLKRRLTLPNLAPEPRDALLYARCV